MRQLQRHVQLFKWYDFQFHFERRKKPIQDKPAATALPRRFRFIGVVVDDDDDGVLVPVVLLLLEEDDFDSFKAVDEGDGAVIVVVVVVAGAFIDDVDLVDVFVILSIHMF